MESNRSSGMDTAVHKVQGGWQQLQDLLEGCEGESQPQAQAEGTGQSWHRTAGYRGATLKNHRYEN